ncbi:hypothetical protein [Klebsiella aerogenes]|uniref:hypothetical protein n=1 Tax=Klebsiella aerogenes TaxID=548 RepID=UPI0012DC81D8|nr:hypothetical protein [Klebsiella aerogenes]
MKPGVSWDTPAPCCAANLSGSRIAARCALSGLLALQPHQYCLKLPVLVASKSLRRSRKAGAARMDAG